MSILFPLICVFLTALFAILAWARFNLERDAQEQVTARFQIFSKKKALPRDSALKLAFKERFLFPLAQKAFDKIKAYIPISSQSWVRTKLLQAGFQKPYHFQTFIGIQCIIAVSMFGGFFAYTILLSKVNFFMGFIVSGIMGFIGLGLPLLWLVQQAGNRQKSIQKTLPDFLDLLVICVEAGMGLDMAINKIAQLKIRRQMKHLKHELNRYIQDIGLGKPRIEALIEITHRTGVEDLNTLIMALANSFEMGTSITHTLRVHSESLRVKRLETAKERANKIPVKMVMPIYVFLFPAIFLAIFGPVSMVLLKTVTQMMQHVPHKF